MSTAVHGKKAFNRDDIQPPTHQYEPRNQCALLFATQDPEVVLSGPAGTGKSRACLEKLNALALKYPGMRGLIVRKTATSLTSSALVTFRTFVIKEALVNGTVKFYGGSASEAAQYIYSNGSRITVGGMDKATRIMSTEFDVIYIQEATELTLEDWESLTTRLRGIGIPYQQIIADTNPDTPTHWLKRRIDEGKTLMLDTRHEDNPMYFDKKGQLTPKGKTYLSRLDNLTGVRYQRLRLGLWVAAEGLIYEDWDPVIHLVDKFTPPDSWPRYWSIDFGFTNPFVLQRWAEDPDGKLYLYAEQYRHGKTVYDHAKDLKKQVKDLEGNWLEPKPALILADHDAEGRETFARSIGLSTTPANKKVLDGIQAVQTRLKSKRLFIMRDATYERDQTLHNQRKPCSTVEEMPGYIWDIGAGKSAKEQPLKKDDHGMDALRYVVAERDLGSRPRVRFLG